jgi:hypothetical protein
VTRARAWESWHQPWLQNEAGIWCGLGFDVAFRPPDDPETERREDLTGVTWDGPWDLLGLMGEALGLDWGGRWRGKRRDRPHFHDTLGHTLAELRELRGVIAGEV